MIGKLVASMCNKCLKRSHLSCLYLFHKFLHNIRRHIYSCKNHLQLLYSLPHFGKGSSCTGSLRFITKLCIRRPQLFICWGRWICFPHRKLPQIWRALSKEIKSAKVFKCYWHIKGSDLRLVKILWLAEGNQTHFVDYQLNLSVKYFENWHMNKSQPQALKTVFSIFLPPTCCTEVGNQYQLHKRFWVNTSLISSREDWKLTLNQFSFHSLCQHNGKSCLFLSTVA